MSVAIEAVEGRRAGERLVGVGAGDEGIVVELVMERVSGEGVVGDAVVLVVVVEIDGRDRRARLLDGARMLELRGRLGEGLDRCAAEERVHPRPRRAGGGVAGAGGCLGRGCGGLGAGAHGLGHISLRGRLVESWREPEQSDQTASAAHAERSTHRERRAGRPSREDSCSGLGGECAQLVI